MSILVNKKSKILVLGFTGSEGTSHSKQMIEYGTNIVGGVTPGKGGMTHLNKPVFNTISEAKKKTGANIAIVFVPPMFAADSMIEAIEANIEIIVGITEGIPTQDMVKLNHYLQLSKSLLIGPNCPGIITPNECKVGIMPGDIFKKGNIGLISKSGTLTYEAADQIAKVGLGISSAVGIGGDPIIGTTTKEVLEMFAEDKETSAIIIIGEIGGNLEKEAALWYKNSKCNKPVVGFIAGQTAPKGKRMGHAGAIIGGSDDSAEAKMNIMRECGIHVVLNPAEIGLKVKELV